MISYETEFIRLAMDEDGLDGTIEDKREHSGHCVLDTIGPKEVWEIRQWCDRVMASVEITHRDHRDALDKEELQALHEWAESCQEEM